MLLGKFDGTMNFKQFFAVIGDKTAYQADAVFIWHFKFLSCFQTAEDFLAEFFLYGVYRFFFLGFPVGRSFAVFGGDI